MRTRHACKCSNSTASGHVDDNLDRPGLRGALKHAVSALNVHQLKAMRDEVARAQAPQRGLHPNCAPLQKSEHRYHTVRLYVVLHRQHEALLMTSSPKRAGAAARPAPPTPHH